MSSLHVRRVTYLVSSLLLATAIGHLLVSGRSGTVFGVVDTGTSFDNHAVIHMGPHKTGTTTIQTYSAELKHELREAGYEMPWYFSNFSKDDGGLGLTGKPRTRGRNEVQFTTCFMHDPKKYPCEPKLLLAASEIGSLGKNLFISSETMSSLNTQQLGSLRVFLRSRFEHIRVIIVYRRYYDWLRSVRNQISKSGGDLRSKQTPLQFFREKIHSYTPGYVVPLLSRLRSNHYDDIVVLNEHGDSTELVEKFYCEAMPDRLRICQAYRNLKVGKLNANPSRDIFYEDFARVAQRSGLVEFRTEEQFTTFVNSAKKLQETTLGLKPEDFKMKCLSDGEVQMLLNMSLHAESTLFPEFFKGPSGEAKLRIDFSEKVNFDMCEVDVQSVFAEPSWTRFLSSLSITIPTDTTR